jgi:hypothetical protein
VLTFLLLWSVAGVIFGLRHLKALVRTKDLRIATRIRVDDTGMSYLAGLTQE